MEMKSLYKVEEMLCKEIDKIAEKGEINAQSLDNLYKLTDVVKNVGKIEMLNEGREEPEYSQRRGYSRDGGMYSERRDSRGRYSRDVGWEARGSFGGGHSYDDGGSSYANRGKHYVRGHYSREDGKDRMMHSLGMLMDEADEHERRILERTMQELRNA